MIIKRITVRNFGSVTFYDADLTPKLNILDTFFTSEISTAIELVLCSKVLQEHDVIGLRDDTLITAKVLVAESSYYIELKPTKEGLLKLTALDDKVNDVTEFYRTLISHCTEQDKYENEKEELKKKIFNLKIQLDELNKKVFHKDMFISAIRRFMETKTITAPLIRELIDHIEVHETEGEGKYKTQRIVIFYRFVGYI